MRYARDDRAKTIVDAHTIGERARRRSFSCPNCGARVHYKRSIGLSPDPIFAHNPHEGSPDCENYFPWQGAYIGSPSPSTPRAPRPIAVEDEPDEFGLCLEDGQTWTVYLRVPELTASELGTVPLGTLTKAFVEVDSAGKRDRLFLIDLRPGVGSARVAVPPISNAYRTSVGGAWPSGIPRRRWETHARGLDGRGTLYRLRRGEWMRLREGSAVELGEELRVVANERSAPPGDCQPVPAKPVVYRGQNWMMWRVRLPAAECPAVSRWLETFGMEAVEPAWEVRIASVPVALDERQTPIFPTRRPIVAAIRGPRFGSRADISLRAGSSSQTESVSTPPDSDTAFVSLSVAWPGDNELRVAYDDRSSISFETTDPESVSDVRDALKSVPALEIVIGDTLVRAWEEPLEIRLPRPSEELPTVAVRPTFEDIRVNLSWDGDEASGAYDSISPDVLARKIINLLETRSSISVRIDGGGLGKLRLEFRAAENPASGISSGAKRRLLFLATAMGQPGVPTRAPVWALRRGARLDPRIRAAASKSINARWGPLLTRTLKEVD